MAATRPETPTGRRIVEHWTTVRLDVTDPEPLILAIEREAVAAARRTVAQGPAGATETADAARPAARTRERTPAPRTAAEWARRYRPRPR